MVRAWNADSQFNPTFCNCSVWQKRCATPSLYHARSISLTSPFLSLPSQAAKASASGKGSKAGSSAGTGTSTPLTSLSANGSTDDLTLPKPDGNGHDAADKSAVNSAAAAMAKLSTAQDRSANGVLVSDPLSRDIKIDQYTLSFHGRLLIEGAEISLNYGQRYGLLGENGSGQSPRPFPAYHFLG